MLEEHGQASDLWGKLHPQGRRLVRGRLLFTEAEERRRREVGGGVDVCRLACDERLRIRRGFGHGHGHVRRRCCPIGRIRLYEWRLVGLVVGLVGLVVGQLRVVGLVGQLRVVDPEVKREGAA